MFKLAGSVFILISSTVILSRNVLNYYFTYKFLEYAEEVLSKLQYENLLNLSYDKLFSKIDFEYKSYIDTAKSNRYIKKTCNRVNFC